MYPSFTLLGFDQNLILWKPDHFRSDKSDACHVFVTIRVYFFFRFRFPNNSESLILIIAFRKRYNIIRSLCSRGERTILRTILLVGSSRKNKSFEIICIKAAARGLFHYGVVNLLMVHTIYVIIYVIM
jgi:hypothetical protein